MKQLGIPTCSHCNADIDNDECITGLCDYCYTEFNCEECMEEKENCVCPKEEVV